MKSDQANRKKEFGAFLTRCIQRYTKKKGISQKELISKLNMDIHPNYITEVKAGRTTLTPELGLELAKTLELDPNTGHEFMKLLFESRLSDDHISILAAMKKYSKQSIGDTIKYYYYNDKNLENAVREFVLKELNITSQDIINQLTDLGSFKILDVCKNLPSEQRMPFINLLEAIKKDPDKINRYAQFDALCECKHGELAYA